MKERIKNPLFLAAAVAFLYNIVNYVSQRFFNVTINPNDWLTFFNLLLFLVMGVGIYSNYSAPNQPAPILPTSEPPLMPYVAPQVQSVSPPVIAPEPVIDSSNEVTVTTEQP